MYQYILKTNPLCVYYFLSLFLCFPFLQEFTVAEMIVRNQCKHYFVRNCFQGQP